MILALFKSIEMRLVFMYHAAKIAFLKNLCPALNDIIYDIVRLVSLNSRFIRNAYREQA